MSAHLVAGPGGCYKSGEAVHAEKGNLQEPSCMFTKWRPEVSRSSQLGKASASLFVVVGKIGFVNVRGNVIDCHGRDSLLK